MRLAIAVAVLLLTVPISAQRSRGGGGGSGGGDFGGSDGPTPFDRLIDALDLEPKQVPAVTTLLDGAEREAAALFQELIPRRQELLNVETNRSTDPAPAAAYAATVTKLIALETKVFEDIYAQLTPNQKQKAAKGFDRLEELFKTTLSTSGAGRGGPGRGGPGRGMPPQGGGQ
jgi:Spy/CpxP family protein refolding chaperone